MPICFSSLGNFERQIEALISRYMYVSKKFVFTSGRREGGGGAGGGQGGFILYVLKALLILQILERIKNYL